MLLEIERLNKLLVIKREKSLKIIKRLQQHSTNLMLKRSLAIYKKEINAITKRQEELWYRYKHGD